MDVFDFEEDYYSEQNAREDWFLKNWTSRLTKDNMKANTFQHHLEREMAIVRIKYPFLDDSQLRGRALKRLNIPSVCGQIPK